MTAVDARTEDSVRHADRRHVFHSWSAQAHINPLPIQGGSGSWFWDYGGTRYLDIGSQMVNLNLGHQHPALITSIKQQADRLCMVGPIHANDQRGEAARLIAEHAPGDLNQVFFTSGGAEANENAVRMARLHTGRHKVLTAHRSYHGATNGAITLTGDPRRWPSEPGMPGVVRFFGPFPYRSSFHAQSPAEECSRALSHLRELVEFEGPHTIAGILVEPVVGSNGAIVPPDGYLQGVREMCDEHGILLICDEVLTGFGRCGEWFAVQHWDVEPDLITFAKGVNSGYVPLGGVIISDRVATTFQDRAYPGGLTYSGHPLACACAVASINVLEADGLVDRVRALADELISPRLTELAHHRSVGEVRGLGFLWAIELVRDHATREPLVPYAAGRDASLPMTEVADACKQLGLWPLTMHNRMLVAPPLNIDEDDLLHGIAILDAALDVADRHADG